jgi:ABC-type uncharacterized transport system permease subunit
MNEILYIVTSMFGGLHFSGVLWVKAYKTANYVIFLINKNLIKNSIIVSMFKELTIFAAYWKIDFRLLCFN